MSPLTERNYTFCTLAPPPFATGEPIGVRKDCLTDQYVVYYGVRSVCRRDTLEEALAFANDVGEDCCYHLTFVGSIKEIPLLFDSEIGETISGALRKVASFLNRLLRKVV